MSDIITITSKFQVYIPQEIRKKAQIKNHGKARISVEGSKIIIEPIKSEFFSLGGAFQVDNPTKAEEIRNKIEFSEKK